uniref:Uncharacterized protein n=1 Tax=Aegilops tauschii subsp. strangulata TaxID=200361 RepID=A0A453E521_AEGTS
MPGKELRTCTSKLSDQQNPDAVISFLRGTAFEQPLPDLVSFLYKNRIMYLAVTRLLIGAINFAPGSNPLSPLFL